MPAQQSKLLYLVSDCKSVGKLWFSISVAQFILTEMLISIAQVQHHCNMATYPLKQNRFEQRSFSQYPLVFPDLYKSRRFRNMLQLELLKQYMNVSAWSILLNCIKRIKVVLVK